MALRSQLPVDSSTISTRTQAGVAPAGLASEFTFHNPGDNPSWSDAVRMPLPDGSERIILPWSGESILIISARNDRYQPSEENTPRPEENEGDEDDAMTRWEDEGGALEGGPQLR